jgi:hypothetical protein
VVGVAGGVGERERMGEREVGEETVFILYPSLTVAQRA